MLLVLGARKRGAGLHGVPRRLKGLESNDSHLSYLQTYSRLFNKPEAKVRLLRLGLRSAE